MRPAFYPFLDASFILAAAWLPFILFGEVCARHFDFNGSLRRSNFLTGRGSVRAKRFFARSAKRGLIRNHLRVSRFLQSGYGTSLKERKSMSGSDILVALALIGISAYAVGSVVLVWTQGTPCADDPTTMCTGLAGLQSAWAGVMDKLGIFVGKPPAVIGASMNALTCAINVVAEAGGTTAFTSDSISALMTDTNCPSSTTKTTTTTGGLLSQATGFITSIPKSVTGFFLGSKTDTPTGMATATTASAEKCFGTGANQKCTNCSYGNDGFKCDVPGFNLPQTMGLGAPIVWMKGAGDPYYIAYYESFPSQEAAMWAFDEDNWAMLFLGVSVLVSMIPIGGKPAAVGTAAAKPTIREAFKNFALRSGAKLKGILTKSEEEVIEAEARALGKEITTETIAKGALSRLLTKDTNAMKEAVQKLVFRFSKPASEATTDITSTMVSKGFLGGEETAIKAYSKLYKAVKNFRLYKGLSAAEAETRGGSRLIDDVLDLLQKGHTLETSEGREAIYKILMKTHFESEEFAGITSKTEFKEMLDNFLSGKATRDLFAPYKGLAKTLTEDDVYLARLVKGGEENLEALFQLSEDVPVEIFDVSTDVGKKLYTETNSKTLKAGINYYDYYAAQGWAGMIRGGINQLETKGITKLLTKSAQILKSLGKSGAPELSEQALKKAEKIATILANSKATKLLLADHILSPAIVPDTVTVDGVTIPVADAAPCLYTAFNTPKKKFICYVLMAAGIVSQQGDSMNEKLMTKGVNTLWLKIPFWPSSNYMLNDEAAKYYIELDRFATGVYGPIRFHLVSPCKADLSVKKDTANCKVTPCDYKEDVFEYAGIADMQRLFRQCFDLGGTLDDCIDPYLKKYGGEDAQNIAQILREKVPSVCGYGSSTTAITADCVQKVYKENVLDVFCYQVPRADGVLQYSKYSVYATPKPTGSGYNFQEYSGMNSNDYAKSTTARATIISNDALANNGVIGTRECAPSGNTFSVDAIIVKASNKGETYCYADQRGLTAFLGIFFTWGIAIISIVVGVLTFGMSIPIQMAIQGGLAVASWYGSEKVDEQMTWPKPG